MVAKYSHNALSARQKNVKRKLCIEKFPNGKDIPDLRGCNIHYDKENAFQRLFVSSGRVSSTDGG
jgi:hypothetical protein